MADVSDLSPIELQVYSEIVSILMHQPGDQKFGVTARQIMEAFAPLIAEREAEAWDAGADVDDPARYGLRRLERVSRMSSRPPSCEPRCARAGSNCIGGGPDVCGGCCACRGGCMTAWELADLVSDDELLAHADDPDCVWEIERRRSAVATGDGEERSAEVDTDRADRSDRAIAAAQKEEAARLAAELKKAANAK